MFTKRSVISDQRRLGVGHKHIWALLCIKQATKSRSFSNGKKRPFFWFGKRAQDAAGNFSPLQTTDPPVIFEAVIYIHCASPGKKRVGGGLIQCRDQSPIVA